MSFGTKAPMTADIDDLSISYDNLGDGKCVVLIHAIGVNRRMWQKIADRLKADYNVIIYDLRGHGGTSASGDSWTLEMFSDDLRGLLDHLGLPSCSIVGLSLGGMIAQTFALRHPSRVDKLVLSNTTAGQTEESRQALYDRADTVEKGGMETIADPTIERWFTPEFIGGCPTVVDRVRSELLECPPRSFAKATRAIAKLSLWDDIVNINAPVLVTTGERDPATDTAVAEQIYLRIHDSRMKVIPDCSHMVPLEQPEAYAWAIGHFLASTSRTEKL